MQKSRLQLYYCHVTDPSWILEPSISGTRKHSVSFSQTPRLFPLTISDKSMHCYPIVLTQRALLYIYTFRSRYLDCESFLNLVSANLFLYQYCREDSEETDNCLQLSRECRRLRVVRSPCEDLAISTRSRYLGALEYFLEKYWLQMREVRLVNNGFYKV